MNARLVYSGKALADLENIFRYIAKDNPAAARTFTEALRQCCRAVAEFPEMGTERPELGSGVRIHPHRRSVIVYRIDGGDIRVPRVLQGGLDYHALIES